MTLIECIPNFSEGRDTKIIEAIVSAIRETEGVILLDVSSDHDHNRTVVTFMGEPYAVENGAFNGIKQAGKLINLDTHGGQHPRIGASDVVPFVPLRDATMQDCIDVARAVGKRVGEELNIPVYLYENASQTPSRQNLADVRRLRYEGLKEAILTDADWKPDYGPSQLGKAGASAIGAREPLVAFNMFLDTDDVTLAQEIAIAVRESGGGLPYLKALGLLVNGQAQVSMNVIDFRKTGLLTVFNRVSDEAQKHGVAITHSELVGLVPRLALIDTALQALKLPPETHALILEQCVGNMTADFRDILFE
jgi:glutamate formiminotransferase